MYKVSEVAEMLSVEKIKIFEILIVYDEKLSPFVTKNKHISYINENGVREIEKLIFDISESDDEIEGDHEIELENQNDDNLQIYQDKILLLKNEIVSLKREMNLLDNDIYKKNEAIRNYQKILNEDIIWIVKLEAKVDSYRDDIMETFEEESKKINFFDKFKK